MAVGHEDSASWAFIRRKLDQVIDDAFHIRA